MSKEKNYIEEIVTPKSKQSKVNVEEKEKEEEKIKNINILNCENAKQNEDKNILKEFDNLEQNISIENSNINTVETNNIKANANANTKTKSNLNTISKLEEEEPEFIRAKKQIKLENVNQGIKTFCRIRPTDSKNGNKKFF